MNKHCFIVVEVLCEPVPVAEPSEAWVCCHSLAQTAGLNPARGIDVCLLCVLGFVR